MSSPSSALVHLLKRGAAILNMRQEPDGLCAFARKADQTRRNQPVSGSAAPIFSGNRSLLRIAERGAGAVTADPACGSDHGRLRAGHTACLGHPVAIKKQRQAIAKASGAADVAASGDAGRERDRRVRPRWAT